MNALRDDAPLAYRHVGATHGPRRLLVLAHGVGGDETNLAPVAARAPPDTAVLLVRAPLVLGPGQYGWFPVVFDTSGPTPDLAAAERSRLQLAGFVAAMQERLGIGPAATVLAGFSQGGIMSASVGLTRPDLLAGFGILGGRILPELEPRLAAHEALAGISAFVGHGRGDTKLTVDWATRAHQWLTRLGVTHETRLYDGGHSITPAMQADLLAWFDTVARRLA